MRIVLESVMVDDQDKALAFYTEKLGFKKKHDMPAGDYKWLTVVAPEDAEGPEILLEPDEMPAAKAFKKAAYEQGMPIQTFGVADVQKEYERLKALDVHFTMTPTPMGEVVVAVFDDTCGNLIQIMQV